MIATIAALDDQNDPQDARGGRRAFFAAAPSGTWHEDVESVFASLSCLLESDEGPQPPNGAVPGSFESGPRSVAARAADDQHTRTTVRPKLMAIPMAARGSQPPPSPLGPRDGRTPVMGTAMATASAAQPGVSSERRTIQATPSSTAATRVLTATPNEPPRTPCGAESTPFMRMTPADARSRLRILAIEASQHDGGRAANQLSAYALLVGERSERGEEMCADLEERAEQTSNGALAAVLREASGIVRSLLDRW